jgi:hypothetical protein
MFAHNHGLRAISLASQLYHAAHNRGLVRRFWSALTGHPHHLLDLEAVRAACDVHNRHYVGIRTVPICQIRGSEGRCKDFDADFRPLGAHSKDRWLSTAIAWQMGTTMPPVKLIQIGDMYFVRDGHHRISVAQALGQKEIEAEVTAWQVSGALPWERRGPFDTPADRLAHQAGCAQNTPGAYTA